LYFYTSISWVFVGAFYAMKLSDMEITQKRLYGHRVVKFEHIFK